MALQIAAAAALAIWIYLLVFRGFFWREFGRGQTALSMRRAARKIGGHPGALGQSSLSPAPPLAAPPRIAAIVPARNEAPVVARAIASLAAQRYPGPFHIILVDDDSSDATAAVARSAAPSDLLTVVHAPPLPPGWSGKLWAISEGLRRAERFEPDYFLLTDADIVHPPGSLESLAARAQAQSFDLVSLMATLACRTPAERALIPAFVFFFFLLYPPAWIRDPRRTTAGAAGGCMLIRRSTLEAMGGLEAIRGDWIDDCALARAVKQHGGRVWLGLGHDTLSIRSYGTFADIGRMISRSAFTQLRHSALLLLATVLGLALTYLAPPLLTLLAPQPAAGMAATAWLLMSVAYLPALRYYGRAWFAAPLLPLVALFYLGATIHSAVSYWTGAGARWKGRAQMPSCPGK